MNKINPKDTALLVIDVQNFFVEEGAPSEIPKGREMIPKLNSLVKELKEKGGMIIYARQRHDHFNNNSFKVPFPDYFMKDGKPLLLQGSHWFNTHSDLVSLQDYFINKDRWSAFYQTELEMILRDKNIKNVIITGLATNICCASTAADAYFRDFNVIFLSDCTVTMDDELQNATLRTIAMSYGHVMSKKDLLDII